MEIYRKWGFFTSALVGVKWSASRPGLFTFGEIFPDIHWIWGWVSSRGRLDDGGEKNLVLQGLKLPPLDYPACTQSLYCYIHITFCYVNVLSSHPCSAASLKNISQQLILWDSFKYWRSDKVVWLYLCGTRFESRSDYSLSRRSSIVSPVACSFTCNSFRWASSRV
jgi:hypothetical protein